MMAAVIVLIGLLDIVKLPRSAGDRFVGRA
jgi:hypothetical protein